MVRVRDERWDILETTQVYLRWIQTVCLCLCLHLTVSLPAKSRSWSYMTLLPDETEATHECLCCVPDCGWYFYSAHATHLYQVLVSNQAYQVCMGNSLIPAAIDTVNVCAIHCTWFVIRLFLWANSVAVCFVAPCVYLYDVLYVMFSQVETKFHSGTD